MPTGSGAQIGLTKPSSFYFSVQSVDFWTNFVSETVEHSIATLEDMSINGYKDNPPSYRGVDTAAGDLNFDPNPNALGAFMRGSFGQSSGTLMCNAGSWGVGSAGLNWKDSQGVARPVVQHYFLPINNAFDPYTFLPPYTMMIYKDQGSAWFFQGTIFPSIEFTITAGQLVKAKSTVMARSIERYTRTSSIQAVAIPGGQPWTWDTASIQLGSTLASLSANTAFEELIIHVEVPMEGVILLDGTTKYAEFQVNGFRKVSLSGKMTFRDQAIYDQFVTYNNYAMRVTMTNVRSDMIIGNPSSAFYYTLQLNLPQFKFSTYKVPVSGPNRLQVDFTARGEFNASSAYMIDAYLTNTTSAY